MKVAVIVGSLRKDSFTKKIAQGLAQMAPSDMSLEFLEIGKLPWYNQDLDADPPKEWIEFRSKIKSFEAVLFVTPEYNRSVPGALKNAIDVGSRPYGSSAWDKKPAAVVSVSPGNISGFGANHHLRQSLVFLNMPVMQQPEAYIGNVTHLLDTDGQVKDENTRKFLKDFMASFKKWIEIILKT